MGFAAHGFQGNIIMRMPQVFYTLAPAAFFCAALSCAAFTLPAYAQDGGYDGASPREYSGTGMQGGYIGQDAPPVAPAGSVTTAQPVPEENAPPSLPAVFDSAGAQPQEDAAPAAADPCADFADYADSYNMCQDRIKKIERMRAAKERRMGTTPAVLPEKTAAPAPEDDAKKAVDKVEELEKKMKEQEEEAAAKKAAPTTKKGIGDFDRDPEKGTSLFK